MRRAVIDLASPYSAWSVPESSLDAIVQGFGAGWQICSTRDRPRPEARNDTVDFETEASVHCGAEVYLGWGIPKNVVREASGTLRWVHSAAAGVGASVTDELRASGAVLTNSRGIHAEPVSDWVVAAIGFCTRGFHEAANAQRERRWAKNALASTGAGLTEFASLRVGVVGLGGIGTAVARKCAALGMEVRAIRRRTSSQMPGYVKWVGGPSQLQELAANCDVLVLALPLTESSAGLVGEEVLKSLPRGAYVLNVSRGGILDEDALLSHLETGHVRGCVLDVFSKEPMEPTHPFWDHPRVFVTPHVSAVTRHFWKRETDLIVENVGRFLRDEPLRNVVNLEAGY